MLFAKFTTCIHSNTVKDNGKGKIFGIRRTFIIDGYWRKDYSSFFFSLLCPDFIRNKYEVVTLSTLFESYEKRRLDRWRVIHSKHLAHDFTMKIMRFAEFIKFFFCVLRWYFSYIYIWSPLLGRTIYKTWRWKCALSSSSSSSFCDYISCSSKMIFWNHSVSSYFELS